ncbi:hypothetical protein BJ742DRAFT_801467, partial [Cladochytrium replicatum]
MNSAWMPMQPVDFRGSTVGGLTVRGLILHHDFAATDVARFDRYVHDLDLSMLRRDLEISEMIGRVRDGVGKWALTNGSEEHADRVLERLGLTGTLDGIVAVEYASEPFVSKCDPQFYVAAAEKAVGGSIDGVEVYFADDSEDNCSVAAGLGWEVVRIEEGGPVESNFRIVRKVSQIRDVWPHLF